jgi:hypothetical protein
MMMALDVVTTRAVVASSLSLRIAVRPQSVALDAARVGDFSPGFRVGGALSDESASHALLPSSGANANVLDVYVGPPGSSPDSTLAPGTQLFQVRLVPQVGFPSAVFPLTADPLQPDPSDPYKPYVATLHSSAGDTTMFSLGMLNAN